MKKWQQAVHGTLMVVMAANSFPVHAQQAVAIPNGANIVEGTVSDNACASAGAATCTINALQRATLSAIVSPLPDCGSLPCTNKIGVLAPLTASSLQTSFVVSTAGTFQQYLASNTARKGCTIQFITSAHTGYVFFGAAPTGTASSWQLSAGQSLNCNVGNQVLTDAIQLTSSNASDAFVVNSW